MQQDMTVPCGNGLINLRVGAIIQKDGRILMVGNRNRPDYLYSVGGRIRFGETAEEAVVREVWEETGVSMEIDRPPRVRTRELFLRRCAVQFRKTDL